MKIQAKETNMKGTFIRASKDGIDEFLHYTVVWDVDSKCYKLLHNDSSTILSGFKGHKKEDIQHYLTNVLRVKIVTWIENHR